MSPIQQNTRARNGSFITWSTLPQREAISWSGWGQTLSVAFIQWRSVNSKQLGNGSRSTEREFTQPDRELECYGSRAITCASHAAKTTIPCTASLWNGQGRPWQLHRSNQRRSVLYRCSVTPTSSISAGIQREVW